MAEGNARTKRLDKKNPTILDAKTSYPQALKIFNIIRRELVVSRGLIAQDPHTVIGAMGYVYNNGSAECVT